MPVSEFVARRRVEFADTDMAGIVHFARFFVFMETAEHEFLRSLGTNVHSVIDGHEVGWPRLEAQCEYLSPLRFGDELTIKVSVRRKGTKSLSYRFDFQHGERVVARGNMSSVCCRLTAEDGLVSIPIPEELAKQIVEAPAP
jgi:acyl-CoA thioester hydrolase